MRVKSREVFIRSPGPGKLAWGTAYYTRARGVDMKRTRMIQTRSDITDSCDIGFSTDNGRTWSDWKTVEIVTKTPEGMHRRIPAPGFIDLATDRLVTMILEGTLPKDDPLEGMKHYYLSYEVSDDGGKTSAVSGRVMQKGHTPEHPFECVWVGKNCIMKGSRPYFRSRAFGHMVFPMQITPLGPDGEYYNPGGGYTWTEAVVLIGKWTDGMKIDWEISERVAIGPDKSTRGLIEPTVAEMADGRMLMVMRASNDAKPELPACKWCAVSVDGGRNWSKPEEWTYDDGTQFFSPSSISQFVMHSNGHCYWLGNITPTKPRGNSPRYPLVIGRVDPVSLKLIRKSMTVVDDLQPGEDPSLQLSNFYARENRETGEIELHLSRFFTQEWFGDALLVRIEP